MSTGCSAHQTFRARADTQIGPLCRLDIRNVELAADGAIKITGRESETGEPDPETPEQLRKLL